MRNLNSTSAGKGEPILFIHGCASDLHFFEATASLLENEYQTILCDRCGYGASPAPSDGDYSIAAQTDDAFAVLAQHASTPPAWVIAHSGGTFIALEMAIHHAEWIKGLILMETPLTYTEAEQRQIAEWFRQMEPYQEKKSAAHVLRVFSAAMGDQPMISSSSSNFIDVYRALKNAETFIKGEYQDFRNYYPAKDAIRCIATPISLVVSKLGRNGIFGMPTITLSAQFGWPLFETDGGHNGPHYAPSSFADVIRAAIVRMSR